MASCSKKRKSQQTTNRAKKRSRSGKSNTRNACIACREAHSSCEDTKPCKRCKKRGIPCQISIFDGNQDRIITFTGDDDSESKSIDTSNTTQQSDLPSSPNSSQLASAIEQKSNPSPKTIPQSTIQPAHQSASQPTIPSYTDSVHGETNGCSDFASWLDFPSLPSHFFTMFQPPRDQDVLDLFSNQSSQNGAEDYVDHLFQPSSSSSVDGLPNDSRSFAMKTPSTHPSFQSPSYTQVGVSTFRDNHLPSHNLSNDTPLSTSQSVNNTVPFVPPPSSSSTLPSSSSTIPSSTSNIQQETQPLSTSQTPFNASTLHAMSLTIQHQSSVIKSLMEHIEVLTRMLHNQKEEYENRVNSIQNIPSSFVEITNPFTECFYTDVPCGMFFLPKDGYQSRLLLCNDAFCKLLGVKYEDLKHLDDTLGDQYSLNYFNCSKEMKPLAFQCIRSMMDRYRSSMVQRGSRKARLNDEIVETSWFINREVIYFKFEAVDEFDDAFSVNGVHFPKTFSLSKDEYVSKEQLLSMYERYIQAITQFSQ